MQQDPDTQELGPSPGPHTVSRALRSALSEHKLLDHSLLANYLLLKKLPWGYFFLWRLLVHSCTRNSIYHQMKFFFFFLRRGCYYFFERELSEEHQLVEAIKKAINIDWKSGCCFGVSMAGVVWPISQQTAGQKGSSGLMGKAMISGTSWGVRSKVGSIIWSWTLRSVRRNS